MFTSIGERLRARTAVYVRNFPTQRNIEDEDKKDQEIKSVTSMFETPRKDQTRDGIT